MTAKKELRPTLEDVHLKVVASISRQEDKEKAAYAVDAIKAYGIDDFFCEYDAFLVNDKLASLAYYVHAAKLYHGSKQHWRRRT